MAPDDVARWAAERQVAEKVDEARNLIRWSGADESFADDYRELVERRALYDAAVDTLRREHKAENLTAAQRTLALISVLEALPAYEDQHDGLAAAWQEALNKGTMRDLHRRLWNLLYGELNASVAYLDQLRQARKAGATG